MVVFDLEVVDAVVVEVLAVLVEDLDFLKGFLRNTGAMSLVLFKFELVEAVRSVAERKIEKHFKERIV